MLKLLMLIGLGVAGFLVAQKIINQGGVTYEPDDLYGAADINRSPD
jgi:hypothetical protein